MLLSIVTPVLNGAKTIERTLRSVAAQRGEIEHIVMDGGSTDGTAEIVERYQSIYPVRVVRQLDRSLYEGVWNGMQLARGDVLAYLNADDIYLPWTLATVAAVMKARKDVSWVTGLPSWMQDESGIAMTSPFAPVYLRGLIRGGWYREGSLGFLQQESMFWRRSLWEVASPRDLLMQYRLAGDFHLWRRFADFAELHTVAAALACFVMSRTQRSHTGRELYLRECGIIAQPQQRRRLFGILHRVISLMQSRRVLRVNLA